MDYKVKNIVKNSVVKGEIGLPEEINTVSRVCSFLQQRERWVSVSVFSGIQVAVRVTSSGSSDELISPPLPLKMVEEPVNPMERGVLGPLPPPLAEDVEEEDDDGDSEEEEVSISVVI